MVQQVGSKSVSKNVGGNRALNVSCYGMLFDPVPKGLTCHRAAVSAGKQYPILRVTDQKGSAVFQVEVKPVQGLFTHRHQPLFITLALNTNDALPLVDLIQVEVDQLRYSESAGVK